MTKIWTDERLEKLNKLKRGKISKSKMASILGVSLYQLNNRIYKEDYTVKNKPINNDGVCDYGKCSLICEDVRFQTLGSRLLIEDGIYRIDGHIVSIVKVIKTINEILHKKGKPLLGKMS